MTAHKLLEPPAYPTVKYVTTWLIDLALVYILKLNDLLIAWKNYILDIMVTIRTL